jgi:hypothetical protein
LDGQTKKAIFRKSLIFDGDALVASAELMRAIDNLPGYEAVYSRKEIVKCASSCWNKKETAVLKLRDL